MARCQLFLNFFAFFAARFESMPQSTFQSMSAAPLIAPFAALRPAPGRAGEVLAPPYDVLDTEEAREWAAGRPWCFLHVSKPEIDMPAEADPYQPAVYAKGAENFRRMLEQGVLLRDERACYYVYRVTAGEHRQTGLVAGASVAAYERGAVRKHELTRPNKEADRARQIDTLGAQTGPVFMAYRSCRGVDDILRHASAGAPVSEATLADGTRHELWVIDERGTMDALTVAFDELGAVYIADGHHRSAAAAKVAVARRQQGGHGDSDPNAPHEYFLAVLFPEHEARILGYHRVARDLNGMDKPAFLAKVATAFACRAVAGPYAPSAAGEFGMYVGGEWFALSAAARRAADDPARRLDAGVLSDHLLEPILGISDPRADERIDFIGGGRGVAELQQRVDSGAAAVAFSLYPTAMADLIAVADAGQVMPPKSTWFEPKLADGMVSRLLD